MSLSTRALKARVRPSPADLPLYTTRETYARATKPGSPPLAPVVGQFSTLIGSSLVPYLYLHGSSTARSFLEGATRARVEVAAPKHAALSRWARDPRPSRRWPGRHPPPSNHVPVAPSHDVNARVDVADRHAPGFVPIPDATSVGMARTLPALGRAVGTHRPHTTCCANRSCWYQPITSIQRVPCELGL